MVRVPLSAMVWGFKKTRKIPEGCNCILFFFLARPHLLIWFKIMTGEAVQGYQAEREEQGGGTELSQKKNGNH
jgi:hypothetical protein